MTDYREINQNLWQKYVEINSKSEYYRLKEFMDGENSLNSLELSEVGDVAGKSLLHLQCHFGMDTLSWARLGASVTGMDFSPEAIELARSLAVQLQLPAKFVCSDIYELPAHLQGQFDVVFTSYGVLAWLPDIPKWAQIAASFVKPGGIFYVVDFHPFAGVFDDEAPGLSVRYPYFDDSPITGEVNGSYADNDTHIDPVSYCNWNHRLGEIVTSLIEAGLQIEFLHEFPFSVYQQLVDLKEVSEGKEHRFVLPQSPAPLPLMFSLCGAKR